MLQMLGGRVVGLIADWVFRAPGESPFSCHTRQFRERLAGKKRSAVIVGKALNLCSYDGDEFKGRGEKVSVDCGMAACNVCVAGLETAEMFFSLTMYNGSVLGAVDCPGWQCGICGLAGLWAAEVEWI